MPKKKGTENQQHLRKHTMFFICQEDGGYKHKILYLFRCEPLSICKMEHTALVQERHRSATTFYLFFFFPFSFFLFLSVFFLFKTDLKSLLAVSHQGVNKATLDWKLTAAS